MASRTGALSASVKSWASLSRIASNELPSGLWRSSAWPVGRGALAPGLGTLPAKG
jgi:hypothetical protein